MEEDIATDASPEARALRVIITGAASGIGRATAQLLAERGAAVAAIDRDEVAGSTLERDARAAGLAVAFVRADVASEAETTAAIVEAIERLGGVDGLVVAAGVMRGQLLPIEDLDLVTWQQVIDVNLRGAFIAAKVVAPRMREAGHGVIVLVGSKAGMIVGSGSYAYGASKGGIHGLALALDRHLGPLGSRRPRGLPGGCRHAAPARVDRGGSDPRRRPGGRGAPAGQAHDAPRCRGGARVPRLGCWRGRPRHGLHRVGGR